MGLGGQVWFRDLPEPLLNSLPTDAINACESEARAAELAAALPEPRRSVLTWLEDLLCSVALFENENKMSLRALGPCACRCSDGAKRWRHGLTLQAARGRHAHAGGARPVATVVGPNLYFDDTTTLLSAMESLRFSQQLVSFLGYRLAQRLRQLRETRAVLAAVTGPI